MARIATAALSGLGVLAASLLAWAEPSELRVEILDPAMDQLLPESRSEVEILGGASVYGGVKHLDVFLVLDTSLSLKRSDRADHRARGAITLVRSLPGRSDIQIGLVEFDTRARLAVPLTKDREALVAALMKLARHGKTDISVGIDMALAGFTRNARQGSTRVMLLFTDGKSNQKKAREAAQRAAAQGVAIHTLLLGDSKKGIEVLSEVAQVTGGSFVRVNDPTDLPEAFMSMRTTGVEQVTLRVNGAAPVPAELVGGTFVGTVALRPGTNRIVATATSLAGETRSDEVTVFVSGPLRVHIDLPFDGHLYPDADRAIEVGGRATLFDSVPASAQAQPDTAPDADPWLQSVAVSVNGAAPVTAWVRNGHFEANVRLALGENRIVARATSADGRTAEDTVTVTVRPPGCSALDVRAQVDGEPAFSISDRAVEIVLDASNSMWGQIDGTAKISIAKESLRQTIAALPSDLLVGLRVYGHQKKRELRDCTDSALLVPLAPLDPARIQAAMAAVKPRGQTPLAYSLQQVTADFGEFSGERAVILLTDGLESCNGDPAQAARALQSGGDLPVHVIGFGLGAADGADLASLEAIADASGGRFLTAESAQQLREALAATVGTPYTVRTAGALVAQGTLGGEPVLLAPGDYVVELASTPPRTLPVQMSQQERATLMLSRDGRSISYDVRRAPADYTPCDAAKPVPAAPIPSAP